MDEASLAGAANGSPLILPPASVQVNNCDRERSRRYQNSGRELSMSAQPLAPNSHMNSHWGD